MAPDMTVDLISATVQVEQPLGNGTRTVATGFLVSDPTPDGRPRVVLVTANHVFNDMPGDEATIGWRVQRPDGGWSFAPQKVEIRNHGKPLWSHHPSRDVAVLAITAPPAFAKAAIPVGWLATDDDFVKNHLAPGDEMMALGFPQGFSANSAGFPILRAGRVASYPLGPSTAFPTFLLDFRVYPGNSGGPVYLHGDGDARVVAGMLTQEVQKGDENLGIGIVTEACFIRQTLSLLDGARGSVSMAAAAPIGPYATDSVAKSAVGER
jgi:S1-C subfamily serine protease